MPVKTLLPANRRSFLAKMASAATILSLTDIASALQGGAREPRFRMAKEIKRSPCFAISPDSRKACIIHLTGKKQNTITVLELSSWKVIFSAPVPEGVYQFGFFRDAGRIYGSVVVSPPDAHESMLIDLDTGQVDRRKIPRNSDPGGYFAEAVKDRILLGNLKGEMVLVEWPSLRHIAATESKGRVKITTDRRIVICIEPSRLVCRRVDDLSVLWFREIDPELSNRRDTSLWCDTSANGEIVALTTSVGLLRGSINSHIEFMEGGNGRTIRHLDVEAADIRVLSPDGKTLGLGRIKGHSGALEAVLDFVDISSGNLVTSVIHERFSPNRALLGAWFDSSGFTPNSEWLITTNQYTTKFWKKD